MMSTYEVLPTLGNPSGKTGYLFNVYTPALYRRRGLSSTLMRHLIEEARRLGIGEILLDYTAEGKSLYEKLGFQPLDKDMVLKVN
ncbi:Acetyltransferase (GNAT) family protein [compost metagenome]